MDATISLILSRHGETEENKLHIMQGQMPGHLSELGKQQAEQLAAVTTPLWLLPGARDWSQSRLPFSAKWIGESIPEKWPMKWISRICRKAWKAWRRCTKEPESFCNSCKRNFPVNVSWPSDTAGSTGPLSYG